MFPVSVIKDLRDNWSEHRNWDWSKGRILGGFEKALRTHIGIKSIEPDFSKKSGGEILINSRMTKLVLGSALMSLTVACATETEVERVDVGKAVITVDDSRFAGTPGLFLIFKESNTGNKVYVSRYQTQTDLAHFQYVKAAPRYQIREEPTSEAVEDVFFTSETWDETAGPPALTWEQAGTVLTNGATYKYRLFNADGLHCVGVARGVSPASADNSLNAYKNMLTGYFCDGSQALTTADVETLIRSLGLRR